MKSEPILIEANEGREKNIYLLIDKNLQDFIACEFTFDTFTSD